MCSARELTEEATKLDDLRKSVVSSTERILRKIESQRPPPETEPVDVTLAMLGKDSSENSTLSGTTGS